VRSSNDLDAEYVPASMVMDVPHRRGHAPHRPLIRKDQRIDKGLRHGLDGKRQLAVADSVSMTIERSDTQAESLRLGGSQLRNVGCPPSRRSSTEAVSTAAGVPSRLAPRPAATASLHSCLLSHSL
jgi:hypothetical protein